MSYERGEQLPCESEEVIQRFRLYKESHYREMQEAETEPDSDVRREADDDTV